VCYKKGKIMYYRDENNGLIDALLSFGGFILGWRIADWQQKSRDKEISDLQKQIDNLKSYKS